MPRFTTCRQFTSARRCVYFSCRARWCSALHRPLSVPFVANVCSTFDQLAQTKRHFQTEGDFKMVLHEQYAPTVKASFQPLPAEPLLIGCPVCGRPAKVNQQLIGEEVACSHCHGTFVVTEQIDGNKTSRSTTAARQPEEQEMSRRSTPLLPSHEQNGLLRPDRHDQSESRHVGQVVRPGDEAYTQLATDLIAAGYRVVRASPPSDALGSCTTPAGGNGNALRRLFLHTEEFEFFTDSFAYQRRAFPASLAISRQRISWPVEAIKSQTSESTS